MAAAHLRVQRAPARALRVLVALRALQLAQQGQQLGVVGRARRPRRTASSARRSQPVARALRAASSAPGGPARALSRSSSRSASASASLPASRRALSLPNSSSATGWSGISLSAEVTIRSAPAKSPTPIMRSASLHARLQPLAAQAAQQLAARALVQGAGGEALRAAA